MYININRGHFSGTVFPAVSTKFEISTKKIHHSTISYSAYFQIKGNNAAEDKNEIALYKYIVFFA